MGDENRGRVSSAHRGAYTLRNNNHTNNTNSNPGARHGASPQPTHAHADPNNNPPPVFLALKLQHKRFNVVVMWAEALRASGRQVHVRTGEHAKVRLKLGQHGGDARGVGLRTQQPQRAAVVPEVTPRLGGVWGTCAVEGGALPGLVRRDVQVLLKRQTAFEQQLLELSDGEDAVVVRRVVALHE